MKRITLSVFIVFIMACTALAQKGENAIGINLGAAPSLECSPSITNFVIGIKYQYGLTDAIRFEGNMNYGFKDKDIDILEISANAHYIFNLSGKMKIYPLLGAGYARLGDIFSTKDNDLHYNESDNKFRIGGVSANKFLLNAGLGAEYALSSKIALGLEVKYQYIKDFSRLPISLGVSYKF